MQARHRRAGSSVRGGSAPLRGSVAASSPSYGQCSEVRAAQRLQACGASSAQVQSQHAACGAQNGVALRHGTACSLINSACVCRCMAASVAAMTHSARTHVRGGRQAHLQLQAVGAQAGLQALRPLPRLCLQCADHRQQLRTLRCRRLPHARGMRRQLRAQGREGEGAGGGVLGVHGAWQRVEWCGVRGAEESKVEEEERKEEGRDAKKEAEQNGVEHALDARTQIGWGLPGCVCMPHPTGQRPLPHAALPAPVCQHSCSTSMLRHPISGCAAPLLAQA